MRKQNVLALYDHGSCSSVFFAGIDNQKNSGFMGKCPNPDCSKPVKLNPTALFNSIDKARRAYIRKIKSGNKPVFWYA
ncbi:MAG TPA: hypothetical protein VIS94_11595 [Desulfomonilia bacterium]|jgi:hypothetical protein